MLGMAYAFEQYAHGAEETKFAPALKYSQDSVVAPETTLPTAPESTTTPPVVTTNTVTVTKTEKAAKAHLVGGVKLSGGKLLATVACSGESGTCHLVLEIGVGKSVDQEVTVSVAAGKKKTVKVKPNKALKKAMKAHPKASVSVRLVAPEGKSAKVKAG